MKGWSAWRVSLSIACALGFVGLVFLLYLSSVHSLPADSDGATVILEGKAMSAGNFMLNHWALSLDSFWLVDVPIYAVAVLVGGVHHQLLNLVPAIIAAAVVAAGAWIAQTRLRPVGGVASGRDGRGDPRPADPRPCRIPAARSAARGDGAVVPGGLRRGAQRPLRVRLVPGRGPVGGRSSRGLPDPRARGRPGRPGGDRGRAADAALEGGRTCRSRRRSAASCSERSCAASPVR